MQATPLQLLADQLLGDETAESFVRSRRAERRSWRLIARDLLEATDGKVDVTAETLRIWYPDVPAEAAS